MGSRMPHDLVRHRARREPYPHRQAHQHVAHDGLEEQLHGAERRLGRGNRHERRAHLAAVHALHVRQQHERHRRKRAGQVPQPHQAPVSQHRAPRHAARDPRAHHEHVAGEQLGAAAEHEHEAQAEAHAAYEPLHGEGQRGIGEERAEEHAAEHDERPGEHCRDEAPAHRQGSLRARRVLDPLFHLGRRKGLQLEPRAFLHRRHVESPSPCSSLAAAKRPPGLTRRAFWPANAPLSQIRARFAPEIPTIFLPAFQPRAHAPGWLFGMHPRRPPSPTEAASGMPRLRKRPTSAGRAPRRPFRAPFPLPAPLAQRALPFPSPSCGDSSHAAVSGRRPGPTLVYCSGNLASGPLIEKGIPWHPRPPATCCDPCPP